MAIIRACAPDEIEAIARVINDAAIAYRGVVPERFLHDPYMPLDELSVEISTVTFYAYDDRGTLAGVMGIEPVADVTLLRHAYVLTARQGQGIGASLLRRIESETETPRLLLGTWRGTRAVDFYRDHGFRLMPDKDDLLARYWPRVGADQAAHSVVLGKAPGTG